MEQTYKELKHDTVAQLRKIAKDIDHEAVKGYTQMNKEHLLQAICKALGLDMHEHHHAVGKDKTSMKKKIKELKKERDLIEEKGEHKNLKIIRRKLHRLKRKLHKATV